MNQRRESAADGVLNAPKSSLWASLVVMGVCCFLLTAGMILTTSPQRYNLRVGDIAPVTITATKDVVDEVTTEQRRQAAAERVPLSFREDDEAVNRVMNRFLAIFQDFEAVCDYGVGLRSGKYASASGKPFEYTGIFLPEDLAHARSLCKTYSPSEWQLTILMKQSQADVSNAYRNTRDTIERIMESTIREGQVETAIQNIQRELQQNIATDLSWNVVLPAVRESIEPNMIVDQEATEADREAARQAVEGWIYKSGQNIVIAGEKVSAAELAVLESLGLLEGNRFDVMMLVGVCILGVLAMLALFFSILQSDRKLMSRLRNALMLAVIFAVALLLSVLAARFNLYLAPISMVALLVATLLSPSLAIACNSIALIVVGVLTNTTSSTFTQQMLSLMFAGTLAAPLGIFIIRKKQTRGSMLLAGVSMAVGYLFAMASIGLLTNHEMKTVIQNAVWAAGGNLLATALCMGVVPMLEWLFNVVTPYKLLELSNPNQPLLRRLLVETPGTYHHSIMVANLAEAAAEAIGADPLLTRVGAYYHDIGKLKRPQYYKENQIDDNPHDRTDPRVSAAIIAEHVTDGIQLGRQNRLPEPVIAFIAEHHGDTQISFFYQKMRSMEGGESAQPEDFQYPGPKPRSVETAILMLADTAEAAVRAGGDQSPEAIEQRIRDLVKGKIDSGQLNDSPLRFADVSKIIRAFAQVLAGIYHKRIEYPRLEQIAKLPPSGRHAIKLVEPIREEKADAAGGD